MNHWQLQDAKARFSELVKRASTDGPQQVTVHGKPAVMVVSVDDYQRLKGERPGFVAFMRRSPLRGVELDIERDRSPTREHEL